MKFVLLALLCAMTYSQTAQERLLQQAQSVLAGFKQHLDNHQYTCPQIEASCMCGLAARYFKGYCAEECKDHAHDIPIPSQEVCAVWFSDGEHYTAEEACEFQFNGKTPEHDVQAGEKLCLQMGGNHGTCTQHSKMNKWINVKQNLICETQEQCEDTQEATFPATESAPDGCNFMPDRNEDFPGTHSHSTCYDQEVPVLDDDGNQIGTGTTVMYYHRDMVQCGTNPN